MTDLYRDEPPAASGNGKLIFTIVIVVALAAAIIAWLWVNQQRQQPTPIEQPQVVEVEVPEQPQQQPQETEQLPPELPETVELEVVEEQPILPELATSTADVIEQLQLAQQDTSALTSTQLIRDAVVFIDNLRNGVVVRDKAGIDGPRNAFRVLEQNDKLYIDPRSYDRYNTLVDWFVSLDTEVLVTMMQRYRPLIVAALAEIGYPDTAPEQVLLEAIAVLNDTPAVGTVVELTDDTVMYRFADPALESLPDAQKQMLRLGPDNIRRVKLKLSAIQAAVSP
ncbi:DUF3014 domain-containing protein [Pseudidiomarina mangrovi]|uniref:DUF3014 domain-containing protein n=1 Tax=Pseudidiomarina mangrovi TaxID=2487133 RepID=UPI000FCC03D8|nr:DUF3014 domain-containing protein [Pseudidiomarina mangrovi]